jgi:hypothetical protein
MLALFVEGERLLELIEAKEVDQVILDLPLWQEQVEAFSFSVTPNQEREIQIQRLQEMAQRIATALGILGHELQKEMNAVVKQHSGAKAYASYS